MGGTHHDDVPRVGRIVQILRLHREDLLLQPRELPVDLRLRVLLLLQVLRHCVRHHPAAHHRAGGHKKAKKRGKNAPNNAKLRLTLEAGSPALRAG
eukprot:COSAG02_NODE_6009_length_3878_cov_2.899974_6_plen_96_part_00